MQAALLPLLIQLDCEDCQGALRDRIKDLIVRWTAVSVSPEYPFCRFFPKVLLRLALLTASSLADAPLDSVRDL